MENKKIFYRIKNVETGKYYTGSSIWVKNPNFDATKAQAFHPHDNLQTAQGRLALKKYPKFFNTDYNGNPRFVGYYNKKFEYELSELPPWIQNFTQYWNEEGKLYTSRTGAELTLSHLTKTSKKLRTNKVDFLLNAPKEASKYKIIPCKMDIVELSSEDEAKILQSGKESQQKVDK